MGIKIKISVISISDADIFEISQDKKNFITLTECADNFWTGKFSEKKVLYLFCQLSDLNPGHLGNKRQALPLCCAVH